ncbi:MAG: hypothetical protein RSB52_07175, partial [Acidaminococcaceae bacterium]
MSLGKKQQILAAFLCATSLAAYYPSTGLGATAGDVTGATLGIGTANTEFTVTNNGSLAIGTNKFTVGGTTGNVATTGSLKVGTNGAFTVAANGNITNAGTITATGKVTANGVDAGTGDIVTTGKVKGNTLGIGNNNDQFVVGADGNTVIKGTLGAGTNGTEFAVDGSGNVTKAGNFSNAGTYNGATIGSTGISGVTDITASGKVDGDTLGIGTSDAFTVANNGNVTTAGTLKVGTDQFQVGAD